MGQTGRHSHVCAPRPPPPQSFECWTPESTQSRGDRPTLNTWHFLLIIHNVADFSIELALDAGEPRPGPDLLEQAFRNSSSRHQNVRLGSQGRSLAPLCFRGIASAVSTAVLYSRAAVLLAAATAAHLAEGLACPSGLTAAVESASRGHLYSGLAECSVRVSPSCPSLGLACHWHRFLCQEQITVPCWCTWNRFLCQAGGFCSLPLSLAQFCLWVLGTQGISP